MSNQADRETLDQMTAMLGMLQRQLNDMRQRVNTDSVPSTTPVPQQEGVVQATMNYPQSAPVQVPAAMNYPQSAPVQVPPTYSAPASIVPLPVATNPAFDIEERVRIALTESSLSNKELASLMRLSEDRIRDVMSELQTAGKVYNMGFEDYPKWTWRLGDNVPGPVLRQMIKRLISERPMTLRDLVRATGVREGHISNQLIEIKRSYDVRDLNGGEGHTQLYFLFPEQAVSVRLPPRGPRDRSKEKKRKKT